MGAAPSALGGAGAGQHPPVMHFRDSPCARDFRAWPGPGSAGTRRICAHPTGETEDRWSWDQHSGLQTRGLGLSVTCGASFEPRGGRVRRANAARGDPGWRFGGGPGPTPPEVSRDGPLPDPTSKGHISPVPGLRQRCPWSLLLAGCHDPLLSSCPSHPLRRGAFDFPSALLATAVPSE